MFKKSTNNMYKFRLIWDNGILDGLNRYIETDTWEHLLAILRKNSHISNNTLDVYHQNEPVGLIYLKRGVFITLDDFPWRLWDWSNFFTHSSRWLLTPLRGNDDNCTDPYIEMIGEA